MKNRDSCLHAFNVALRFLSYRPRSEVEVRTRLGHRFSPTIVDRVLVALQDRGLVNDSDFASLWRDNRSSFNPRSADSIRRELTAKGVSSEIAEDTVRDMDDLYNACRAGRRLAQRLAPCDFTSFASRLRGHLHRRGFSADIVRQAISHLWDQNLDNTPAPSWENEDTDLTHTRRF